MSGLGSSPPSASIRHSPTWSGSAGRMAAWPSARSLRVHRALHHGPHVPRGATSTRWGPPMVDDAWRARSSAPQRRGRIPPRPGHRSGRGGGGLAAAQQKMGPSSWKQLAAHRAPRAQGYEGRVGHPRMRTMTGPQGRDGPHHDGPRPRLRAPSPITRRNNADAVRCPRPCA